MEPFKTRGYGMITAVKYVREALDPERRAIVLERIPPETLRIMETAKPTEWYAASLRLDDRNGYAHLAPMSTGWSISALESMGQKLSQSRIHGWSLAETDSGSFSLELGWKA